MTSNVGSRAGSKETVNVSNEILDVMDILRACLVRLDAIGAHVPAVHLETCLHELSRSFISQEIISEEE